MHRNSRAGRTQRGNILFLILLAVVLFAALSYAVTAAMRGGTKDGSSEDANLLASQIIQNAALIESTIQRLVLVNACSDTEISFWEDSDGNGSRNTADNYYNPNERVDFSCNLFHSNGGGLASVAVPSDALDASFSTISGYGEYFFIKDLQMMGVGTSDCSDGSCRDLALIITGLTRAVCQELSKSLIGYDGIYSAQAQGLGWHISNSLFRGAYTAHGSGDENRLGEIPGHSQEANLYGRTSFCFTNNPPGDRQDFVHILIAR